MAVEVGLEDDVFFADLNRQISLLIDDDDDDDGGDYDAPNAHFPFISVPPQIIFSPSNIEYPSMLQSTQQIHIQNWRKECVMSNKGSGTGVFIPQWPQLRRKYKEQRRRAKSNNNNKQVINSKGRANGTLKP